MNKTFLAILLTIVPILVFALISVAMGDFSIERLTFLIAVFVLYLLTKNELKIK